MTLARMPEMRRIDDVHDGQVGDAEQQLNALGFKTAAMALSDNSVSLDEPLLKQEPKLALIMGTEGDGLPHHVISHADYVVRIPMKHGVDSLNVAAASAVAFWELRSRDQKDDKTIPHN